MELLEFCISGLAAIWFLGRFESPQRERHGDLEWRKQFMRLSYPCCRSTVDDCLHDYDRTQCLYYSELEWDWPRF